jgi:hypothetical protein
VRCLRNRLSKHLEILANTAYLHLGGAQRFFSFDDGGVMERERNIWGRDEISVLRERIAVLETNLSAMQANIKALTDGQNANRAYTEKSFNELKDAFAKMHEELSDLKLVVTSRAIPTDGQKQTQRYVLAIGALLAILIMVLLVIWIRLGYMGIHL